MRFCWIQQHKDQYRVSVMCELLAVSRSGYYDWARGREPGKRQQRREELEVKIKQAYQASRCTYGSPRVYQELPDKAWAADITYIPTDEGWLYLGVVIDLTSASSVEPCSRRIVGWSMVCSMSHKGNCYDNAVAESFFKTLKTEQLYHRHYATRQEAKASIFDYIEVFYNLKRRHSSLGYLSPAEYEASLN